MSTLEVNKEQLLSHLKEVAGNNNKIAGIVCHTPLYLNQDNGSEVQPYYQYQFEGNIVVWVNPLILSTKDKTFSCARIFVMGRRRHNELLATARHFAGLVSFLSHNAVMIEAKHTQGSLNDPRLDLLEMSQGSFLLDKYVFISNGSNIGDILDVACSPHYPVDEQGILALSHILEASSSFSIYWTYLCYWKILEILHGRVRRGQGGGGISTYLDSNVPLNHNQQDWVNRHSSTYRRLYGTRNAVGHWRNDREPTVRDPADERLRERVEKDLPILWIFVRYSLNPKFGLRAY